MLVAVAPAVTATIITAARLKRHQKRFGFGGGSGSPLGGGFFGGQPGANGSVLEPARGRPQEGLERLPVGLQRGDRDPLLGTVVAGADRPELDRRHPHPQERNRGGG